jgi:hypothetical protein
MNQLMRDGDCAYMSVAHIPALPRGVPRSHDSHVTWNAARAGRARAVDPLMNNV